MDDVAYEDRGPDDLMEPLIDHLEVYHPGYIISLLRNVPIADVIHMHNAEHECIPMDTLGHIHLSDDDLRAIPVE